jgi:flavin-dependent dehydrogenase
MSIDCDVAVVGAGPAGAATARRLAQAGCHVALLERTHFDSPRAGESLAPAVQPLLADLGVWPQFIDLSPLPSYGTRSSWGSAEPGDHSHLLTPYLSGWHVDRQAFDRMLAETALQAGAQLHLGARVIRVEAETKGGTLFVADSTGAKQVRAEFIVDASGRGAALARWVGARHVLLDRLVGIGAGYPDPHAGTQCYTQIEATEDGWWYSAPAAADRCVRMLMTDADLARAQGLASQSAWHAALVRAPLTRARGDIGPPLWGPRIFPAVSQRLQRGGERAPLGWLAVGDAALAVDPLSGSGVVRALRMAAAAAETVMSTLGGEPGDRASAIAAYEHERDRECTRYLFERASYYAAETRWPRSAFWSRRAHVLHAFETEAHT